MNVQNTLLNLSVEKLQKAIAIKQQIDSLQKQLANLGGEVPTPAAKSAGPQIMSNAARAKISAAMRARWVRIRAAKAGKSGGPQKMSPAAKAKISAAMKARWAKIKAAKPAGAKAAAPKKSNVSAAIRAKISAGMRARWARIRAAKAKAS